MRCGEKEDDREMGKRGSLPVLASIGMLKVQLSVSFGAD